MRKKHDSKFHSRTNLRPKKEKVKKNLLPLNDKLNKWSWQTSKQERHIFDVFSSGNVAWSLKEKQNSSVQISLSGETRTVHWLQSYTYVLISLLVERRPVLDRGCTRQ